MPCTCWCKPTATKQPTSRRYTIGHTQAHALCLPQHVCLSAHACPQTGKRVPAPTFAAISMCICVCMQMHARTRVHTCTLITTEHTCVRAHTGRPGSASSARHGTLPPVADYAYPAMGHAQILAQVCVLPHNGSGYESHPCMVKTYHMTCPARSSTGVFVNHVPRCVLSQVGTQGSGICHAGMTCSACATTSWALFLGSSPEPMQL